MWRRQLKYLLHPAVTGDKEIMSVADIGCGTGYISHSTKYGSMISKIYPAYG